MPLLTLKDLLEGDPAEVETLIARTAGISDMYETFEAEDQEDNHYRAPGIHASEVSGCDRRMVYTMRGEPKTSKTRPIWKRRFKVGHAIHDMFQRDFERMSQKSGLVISFEREVRINPKLQLLAATWDIHSSCDGVFVIRETWDGPAIARCILEIKTEAPDSYEKLKEPKLAHVEQAHVYMACLDIPLTWFLYFNKGNQNFTPATNPNFFIRYNPEVWKNLESRFEVGHTHLHLNTLPDRQESILCEFCSYPDSCKPAYLNRKPRGFNPAPASWK